MGPALPDQPEVVPGDVVAGRYRIEVLLGRGGFGHVFRAKVEPDGGKVAIKILLRSMFGHPTGLARFQQEAELLRRLEHPNTVRVLDFGVTPEGIAYIACEYLKGRSLGHVLRKGPLATERVARIGIMALGALEEAHREGIVHRDIKPENVFLFDDGPGREGVKLLDFGLAKALEPPGREAPKAQLTMQGEAPGTPSYMAPEQAFGGQVTPAADLYALGLTLAEALTSTRVFDDPTSTQTLRRQASPEPVRLPPGVAESPLGAVIERATRKRPAERFPSATAMREAIEAVINNLSSRVPKPGVTEMGAPVPEALTPPPPQPAPQVASEPVTQLGAPVPEAMARPSVPYIEVSPYVEAPPSARVPPPPTVRRRAPSLWRWILPVAVVTVIGGAVLGVLLYQEHSSSAPVARKEPARPKNPPPVAPPAPAPAPAPAGPKSWKDISDQALKDRLTGLRWSITQETTSPQPQGPVLMLQFRKGSRQGALHLYRFHEEALAAQADESLRLTQRYPSARDGSTVLLVQVFDDMSASNRLLDQLTK